MAKLDISFGLMYSAVTDITIDGCGQYRNLGMYSCGLTAKEVKQIFKVIGDEKFKKIKEQLEKDYEEAKEEEKRYIKAKPLKPKYAGYIYLVKSAGLCKVGRAKRLKSRLKTYKTENPFGVEVLSQVFVEDSIKVEKYFLDKFKDKQVRGEWFKLDKEDIAKFQIEAINFKK